MADDKDVVPEGKTIVDGMAGNSLAPDTEIVPAQAGMPGHTSDRLDTTPQEPPPPRSSDERRHEDSSPDETSADDVVEIIETTRDNNPTNQNAVRNRR